MRSSYDLVRRSFSSTWLPLAISKDLAGTRFSGSRCARHGSWFHGSNLTLKEVLYFRYDIRGFQLFIPGKRRHLANQECASSHPSQRYFRHVIVTSANIADIAFPRMTASHAAMFGQAGVRGKNRCCLAARGCCEEFAEAVICE